MDSSQRALQTKGEIFQISESFFELVTIFYKKCGVWFMHASEVGEAFVLISVRVLV